MSDETVIVRGTGTIFLGGPPLVKAATGEDVSAEDLGGADVHTRKSGVADYLAQNDDEALQIGRRIVASLPRHKVLHWEVAEVRAPKLDPAELYGVIPSELRRQVDV